MQTIHPFAACRVDTIMLRAIVRPDSSQAQDSSVSEPFCLVLEQLYSLTGMVEIRTSVLKKSLIPSAFSRGLTSVLEHFVFTRDPWNLYTVIITRTLLVGL